MPAPLIQLKSVSKVYAESRTAAVATALGWKAPSGLTALAAIDLEIASGEILGIVGRNGSGKSTLLQLIAGTLRPSTGEVRVNGRVAALLELGSGFNPDYTGLENVYLNAAILGMAREEIARRLSSILAFAEIGEAVHRPVKTYSSGMVMRLAFAVAVHVEPQILIVDEALAVGDLAFQAKCYARFREFVAQGVTVLFVTHSMDLVTTWCSRAILLDRGVCLMEGAPKAVVNAYNRLLAQGSSNFKHEQPTRPARVSLEPEWGGLFTINPAHEGYGDGRASIVEMGLFADGGQALHIGVRGQELVVKIKLAFHEDMDMPVCAFQFRSLKGQVVCGTNTDAQRKPLGPVRAGDMLLLEAAHVLRLNPGHYSLSVSVGQLNAASESGLDIFERCMDYLLFEVAADSHRAGVFDMDCALSVYRAERQLEVSS